MNNSDFENILSMIAPKIIKKDTSFRKAIPVSQRLAVTLRFLASGDSYTSLGYLLKISKQAISYIVPEVCDALIVALQNYVKVPRSAEEWERVAKLFNDKWNYPNYVGAIDGKHINIQAPEHSGTELFNYKGFFSIVLLAVVDANYNFIYTNVGCQGRISDGGVLNGTFFKKCLDDNKMHLPPSRPLPQLSLPIPYVFVGDEAFQLTPTVMKPFSGIHNKRTTKRIFNYRLSRARRVSENAFGIMSSSFRIFRRPILLDPGVATKVTLAAIYLHNYLRNSGSRNVYCSVGMLDSEFPNSGEVVPGIWRRDPSTSQINNLPTVPKRSCIEAQTVREEFAKYFISAQGELHFQYDK
ncbi:uncharacterized protein LOC112681136 [Sipha flava]|uniref:Uncharacterized protein LOC112681136 n=1 Tax=Sipha flava TaxID=143950 RepID=A0A8B8F987_9HEMI|nr:uncharacterized protein LOC112681136 [Sipha flava]